MRHLLHIERCDDPTRPPEPALTRRPAAADAQQMAGQFGALATRFDAGGARISEQCEANARAQSEALASTDRPRGNC